MIDVSIEYSPVASGLPGATHTGVLWQARRGAYLLDVPDVARYLVAEGARVSVDANAGADPDEVERYLGTTPLAALHLQRGQPVLHAAWVVPPDGSAAVVLAGDSATGKSTLAAALARRGWHVGADDLTPVGLVGDQVVAAATGSSLVLWPGVVERMSDLDATPEGPDGLRRRVAATAAHNAMPIASIFWLGHHNLPDIESSPVAGAKAFHAISRMAYNSRVADALLDRSAYFDVATSLARLPIARLVTPRGRWSVEEAADLVAAKP